MAVVATPQEMDDAAATIESSTREIDSILNNMKNHVAEISSNWTDQNGATFNEKFEEVKNEMPYYIDRAEATASFMRGVAEAYREAISVNSKAVNTSEVVEG